METIVRPTFNIRALPVSFPIVCGLLKVTSAISVSPFGDIISDAVGCGFEPSNDRENPCAPILIDAEAFTPSVGAPQTLRKFGGINRALNDLELISTGEIVTIKTPKGLLYKVNLSDGGTASLRRFSKTFSDNTPNFAM